VHALAGLATQFDGALPDILPVFDGDLSRRPPRGARAGSEQPGVVALLSRVLFAFERDCGGESSLPMATGSNVLRALDDVGVRVADLPALTGLAKEGVASSLSVLERRGCVEVGAGPSGRRVRVARLTSRGLAAQDSYRRRLEDVENLWRERHGPAVSAVRQALEPLVGEPAAGPSPLFGGYARYPDGWRASVRRPDTLPHYPMMSHRGGFPDGS
jgi:hypothetical protein